MKKALFISLMFLSSTVLAQVTEGESSNVNSSKGTLRARTHAMSWDYSSGVTKMEEQNTGNEVEITSGEMTFGYLYNLGHFEVGVGLSSENSKTKDVADETSNATFSFIGEYNFIENRPGKDLIPYLSLSLGGVAVKSEGDPDISGSNLGLGVGLKWFPFSEIFALKAQLSFLRGELETDNSVADFKMAITELSVGWSLYF